jgi:Flp pilus assembly protein TadB
MKRKQELPGALRIIRREIKEGVPSTTPLSG